MVSGAHTHLRRLSAPLPGLRVTAALAVLALASVLLVKHHSGTPWEWRTAVALALAPVASTSIAAVAQRAAGPRFAAAAGAVYALLPFAARHYFYGTLLGPYDRHVMPALVGLERTGWFALGVALCIAIAVLPERLAGALGLLGAGVAAIVWIDASWDGLFAEFHESTWSPTLLCFLPFAATIGLALRRPWLAGAVSGWVAVLVLRGVHRPYGAGGLWLSVAGAAPEVAVLLTSVALLVPPLRPRRSPALSRDPVS